MKTIYFTAADLEEVKVQDTIRKAFQDDELVVFPTETVYGIGANALSETAVKKIFSIKGRPSDNPLIVHLPNQQDIYKYIKNIPSYAEALMVAFWPGPLTLIFPNDGVFSNAVTAGLDTVAIRVPDHPIANKVLSLSGLPICAPSANISGRPSSTLFSHVKDDFDGLVSILIDGGSTKIGLESTVLDLTVDIPAILRPGRVTKEMIENVLKIEIIDHLGQDIKNTPKSPGMKYKHYAPKGSVTLIEGDFEAVVNFLNKLSLEEEDKRIAVLCPDEYESHLHLKTVIKLGSLNNLDAIGENIFKSLRLMDEMNIDEIYIPAINTEGYGVAIMNRLIKAANNNIIKV
jgi:L-threonylcarbamoyladenylate synthase